MNLPLKLLSSLALAASFTLALPAQRADAYPVDCAILLCLSGGWPASAECSHARAVFIRRITPWPVEPPLQIWNCPMGAASNTHGPSPFMDTLRRLARTTLIEPTDGYVLDARTMGDETPAPFPALFSASNEETRSALLHLVQDISTANGTADIDISGPEFDYVRSIKVWNVMSYSHRKYGRDEECRVRSNITLGTYGTQGDFHWQRVPSAPVPAWVIPSRSCEPSSYTRAVGIEWTDYQGNHGYEVVNY